MGKTLTLLIGCAALMACAGCGHERTPEPLKEVVTREDLLAFNQEKAERERLFIDSLVASIHSSVMPHYAETATGLRVWSSDRFEQPGTPLALGDTVQWVGELMLTDSTVLSTWTEEEPLRFLWNRSDWPAGFHELAALLADGQRAACLVPSHMAWGLTGYPPLVPQEAVLLLNIRQQMPGSGQVGLEVCYTYRHVWNALLDGMEEGVWPGDADWIQSPGLAASPCMAWYETDDGFEFDEPAEHVSVEMRTFRLTIDMDVPEDLGASSWDFDPSDGGQLLPVLADLQRLYPLKRKWACWCPADVVIDEPGMRALGVTKSDVLGFQWEFQAVDVPLSVQ